MLLTYSELLGESLLLFLTFFGAVVTALLAGISFHEFSHAITADRLGDNTPRSRGRVSLNPARHLDPMGTFFLILGGFGWGKPVPVNPFHLHPNPRSGRAIVAAAGPVSNLILAVVASIPLHLGLVDWPSNLLEPSIDGWELGDYVGFFLSALIFFNIVLAVFNLLPIAPLDGFAVALGLLPRDLSMTVARLEPYGPGILMLLIVLPFVAPGSVSVLHEVMSPIINGLMKLIAGGGTALG